MTPKEIVPLSAAIDDILKSMGHKTHKLAKVSDGEIILASICAEKYMNGNQLLTLKVMQEIGYVGRGISISRFNRRIHKLYHLTLRIIELLSCLQRDKTAYIIDSIPVQVCKQVRRNRCKKVRGGTFQGYCAAKKEFFFGYRLHLSCNLEGCPVSFRIEPASAHDGQFTEQLTSILPSGSRVAADKGYISAKTEDHLYNLYGVRLVVEKRSNMKPNSKSDNDFIKTNRKRIETLFSQFEKMGLQRIQARTLKGLFIKVHAAILSTLFAFAVQTSN